MRNQFIQLFLLIAIGVLSGVVTSILFPEIVGDRFWLICFVGIPYGIITGLYFIITTSSSQKLSEMIFWTTASTASFFLAAMTTALSFSYAAGGALGALLLAGAFEAKFQRMKAYWVVVIAVAGGSIGWWYAPVGDNFGNLYIVWQTIITVLLGVTIVFKHLAARS